MIYVVSKSFLSVTFFRIWIYLLILGFWFCFTSNGESTHSVFCVINRDMWLWEVWIPCFSISIFCVVHQPYEYDTKFKGTDRD